VVASADEALQRLIDGNLRFAHETPRHPHESADWRQSVEDAQHPFAVVLGCSDSRVPPELIFDQGLGDLFVVRVAGNDTHLIVVMGHTHCEAVTATLDHLNDPEGEPAEVVELLYRIEPATMSIDKTLPREEQIELAVRHNVEAAVRRLSRVPDLRRSLSEGKAKIVGAMYDMHTGEVRFLDPPVE